MTSFAALDFQKAGQGIHRRRLFRSVVEVVLISPGLGRAVAEPEFVLDLAEATRPAPRLALAFGVIAGTVSAVE
jgi:hypothetical protein